MLNCRICQIDLTQSAPSDDGTTSDQTSPNTSTERKSGPSSSGNSRKRPSKKKVFMPNAIGTDITAGACGHVFHTKCLQTYFANNTKKCPVCTKSLAGTKIIRVFPTIDRNIKNSNDYEALPVETPKTRVPIVDRIKTFTPVSYQGDSYYELKEIHTMLMSDYEELQRESLSQKEELQTKDAILSSIQDQIQSDRIELQALKSIETQETERKEKRKRMF